MQCTNHLKQLALGCLNFEAQKGAYPRGNALTGTFPDGGNTSWMFQALAYTESNNLYAQIVASGSLVAAVTQNILGQFAPALPMARCPSDGWLLNDGRQHNYVACIGPQCNGSAGFTTPFQKYCNGGSGGSLDDPTTNPPTLGTPPSPVSTYPGYSTSISYGNTFRLLYTRGIFSRGGTVVRVADVNDGTSNTLMLGETLPEFDEFQRPEVQGGNCPGWAGGNWVAQGGTIVPINWPIDDVPLGTSAALIQACDHSINPSGPDHCLWNWAVTWGLKSHHPGGANFALADGSATFISEMIDHKTYQYLGCRDDGCPVVVP